MSDQFPRGKLSDDDEGVLPTRIGVRDKTVIIDFGKAVEWIGLDADSAIQFANSILEKARSLKPEPKRTKL